MILRKDSECRYKTLCFVLECPSIYGYCSTYQERKSQEKAINEGQRGHSELENNLNQYSFHCYIQTPLEYVTGSLPSKRDGSSKYLKKLNPL